jgi:hypothetical protein
MPINAVAETGKIELKPLELPGRGYLIEPFLESAEIEALKQVYRETTPEVPSDFYISAFAKNPAVKRRILEGISHVVQDRLKVLAPGYRILLASFATKKAKSLHGAQGLHADYSLVDHSRHLGPNVWCPLSDVDNRNGCLCVVEGSQVLGHIGSTPPAPSPYGGVVGKLESKYKIEVPMAAGSAFLFDTRLLHASGENSTDSDRTALLFSLVPENASALLYQWNVRQPQKLEVYEVDTEFILRMTPYQYIEHADREGAKFLGFLNYNPRQLIVADLERMLPRPDSAARSARTPTGFSRLWNLIRS